MRTRCSVVVAAVLSCGGSLAAQPPTLEAGVLRFVTAGNGVAQECPERGSGRAVALRAEQRFGAGPIGVALGVRRSVGRRRDTCPIGAPPAPPPGRVETSTRASIAGTEYTAFDLQGRLHRQWGRLGGVLGVGAGYSARPAGNSPYALVAGGGRLVLGGRIHVGVEGEATQWRVWTEDQAVTYDAFGGIVSIDRLSRRGAWARGTVLALWVGVSP